jgi:Kef-type K+ transport system membrane component KefB
MSQDGAKLAVRKALWGILGYAAMISVAVGGFLLARSYAADLTAPAPSAAVLAVGGATLAKRVEVLPHVLIALVVVLAASRGLGLLFQRIHQPPVIGEVLAGILLGPSLLGAAAPSASAFILPAEVAPSLSILAQVGVILFMFLVGVELDTGLLRKRSHATVAISHASIIAPFTLGTILAVALYPRLSSSNVSFTSFALFMGVSMSVTAFPVLARILTDRRMHRTRLGVIALTCAAVDDVTAWCLLAFVVSVVQSGGQGIGFTLGMTAAYGILMLTAGRFLVRRFVGRVEALGRVTRDHVTIVFVALLLSALATETIGIHALFGAFLLGVLVPHRSLLASEIMHRLEDLVVLLLLPAFFAFTGMRTQIGLVQGAESWAMVGAILLVACLGKFGGSTLAARLTGSSWRESASIGVLMNTRGLMELIVLNIGLDLGVISPTLFAMLVLMALVTTFATTPVLHLLTRGGATEGGVPGAVPGVGPLA